MQMDRMISALKKHPRFEEVGMILCHNGVVRATARDGRKVTGLRVAVDHQQLQKVIAQHKSRPGIVEILVEIVEDRDLEVGADVMLLAVAGNVRENVIAVLHDTLDAIKATVTTKTEYYLN